MTAAAINLQNHPCFNRSAAHQTARVHLPVAPHCNVQCNFCSRRMDCVNEGRPGVTSAVLTPPQALSYLERLAAKRDNIGVVGIAGPGDPMANAEETLATLRLVRERYPQMLLCLATNGLELLEHIPALAQLRLSHVTLTINGIDPAIAARVYAWGRFNKHVLRGEVLGKLMVERQLAALQSLKDHGILVKVNSIILPGVNDAHIPEVARVVAEFGADVMNCVPLLPVADTPFHALGQPDGKTVARVRLMSERFLPQMNHCARCRADAAGLVGERRCRRNRAAHPGIRPLRRFITALCRRGDHGRGAGQPASGRGGPVPDLRPGAGGAQPVSLPRDACRPGTRHRR